MNYPELENRFTFHKPFGDQTDRYAVLRDRGLDFAKFIDTQVPDCREKSLAITKLQEVIMWANAGIACNEIDRTI